MADGGDREPHVGLRAEIGLQERQHRHAAFDCGGRRFQDRLCRLMQGFSRFGLRRLQVCQPIMAFVSASPEKTSAPFSSLTAAAWASRAPRRVVSASKMGSTPGA